MAQPYVLFTLRDVSGEKSTVKVNLPDITAANFDAITDWSTGAVSELLTDLRVLTACEVISARICLVPETFNNPLPGNFLMAHREHKILIRYRDTVNGKEHFMEVAGPDYLTMGAPTAGTDFYPINIAPGLAVFVTELETQAVSPAGNAIEVLSAQSVGRNT